jgi:excisionase family DNA binding protein
MSTDNEPRLLTTGKAAKLCSVKPDTILKWIKKGRLEAVRTAGGHYRIQVQDIEPLIHGRRFGDLTGPPPPECHPQPLRCWEYLSPRGETREECEKCVVYRLRAAWCFQVAGLGQDIGHAKHFCRTSCDDCVYYRRVSGLATNVLVITSDQELVYRLAGDQTKSLSFRFARNTYEASAEIHSFRPGFVVLDRELTEVSETELAAHLARDQRVPGLRIILAVRPGKAGRRLNGPSGDIVVGVVEKPFSTRHIAAVIDSLPVEALSEPQGTGKEERDGGRSEANPAAGIR